MENLVMFDRVYADRPVLVTGHTGFKGSWLCLWLNMLGAKVHGLALPPQDRSSHYVLSQPDVNSELADIQDYQNVLRALRQARPQVVFHLAAQPIVRHGYAHPLKTLNTNIMGTAHVLEACRFVDSVRAVVVISSDKCYEAGDGSCRETDPLGGSDPYSASKGCTELVTSAYRRSFFSGLSRERDNILVASARAGNVIGGGDWGEDRLIPDIMRSVAAGRAAGIRNPAAVRPWQHVLEPLSGYLLLGRDLLQGKSDSARAWNFGPRDKVKISVDRLVQLMQEIWPSISCTYPGDENAPPEVSLLRLDSSLARGKLGWMPVWDVNTAVQKTVQWYKDYLTAGKVISGSQLQDYVKDAQRLGMPWLNGRAR